jgi:hypothetical protein
MQAGDSLAAEGAEKAVDAAPATAVVAEERPVVAAGTEGAAAETKPAEAAVTEAAAGLATAAPVAEANHISSAAMAAPAAIPSVPAAAAATPVATAPAAAAPNAAATAAALMASSPAMFQASQPVRLGGGETALQLCIPSLCQHVLAHLRLRGPLSRRRRLLLILDLRHNWPRPADCLPRSSLATLQWRCPPLPQWHAPRLLMAAARMMTKMMTKMTTEATAVGPSAKVLHQPCGNSTAKQLGVCTFIKQAYALYVLTTFCC